MLPTDAMSWQCPLLRRGPFGVALVLVAMSGCRADPSALGAGAGDAPSASTPAADAGAGANADADVDADAGTPHGPSAPTSFRCTSDDDCQLSCVTGMDCCGNPCGCDTVRHKDEHEQIRKAQIEYCSDKIEECAEQVACAPDVEHAVPRCIDGACVGELPASRK